MSALSDMDWIYQTDIKEDDAPLIPKTTKMNLGKIISQEEYDKLKAIESFATKLKNSIVEPDISLTSDELWELI